jgi:hypothetical protein
MIRLHSEISSGWRVVLKNDNLKCDRKRHCLLWATLLLLHGKAAMPAAAAASQLSVHAQHRLPYHSPGGSLCCISSFQKAFHSKLRDVARVAGERLLVTKQCALAKQLTERKQ